MRRYTKLNDTQCPDTRTCPSVNIADDRKTFAMVGRLLSPEESADLGVGPGEVAIEMPAEVVEEGMSAYTDTAR